MKKAIYPFKFIPQPKERVWGGHRLAAQFHKPFDAEKVIGESWEISGFEDDSSVIAGGWLDGNPLFDVIETYMDEIVGDDNYKPLTGTTPMARTRPGMSLRPTLMPGYIWDSTRIWMCLSSWTAAPKALSRRCSMS